MVEELAVIGKPEHLDKQSWLVVTGKLDFAADKNFPGKLHARILGSPYAHARITSIDTSKALALPGVEAVTTYEDCPIMVEELLYWGQEVAAVAAVDPHVAAAALELIDVDYEVLPFVIDPDEAMESDAPHVGNWPEGNVTPGNPVDRGDIDAGFAEADVVVEDTVGWTGFFQHNNIEPRSSVAYWVGDQLYVWTCSQNPFSHRLMISTLLGVPQNKVHLISHGTGLAQGDKTTQEQVIIAAVLSQKTGKPVEMHLSRKEYMLNGRHQTPGKATIRIGCKSDGTITAMDATFYADVGSDVDPPSRGRAAGYTSAYRQNYKCPNVRHVGYNVATNKPRTGYYRCVGDPTAIWLYEIVVDQMAYELGMDPLEFRLKNTVTLDMAHQDTGKPYSSMALKECFEAAASAIGWANKWHAPGARTLPDGRKHGIGISGGVINKGMILLFPGFGSGGIVNLNADGTALINCGISRVGGGTNTAICHIVAETLGMSYEDVNTGDWGNTDVCNAGGGQNGSTRTITTGAAFQRAAEDARAQLLEAAVPFFGVGSADELDISEGTIFVKADPANSKKFSEVTGRLANPITGVGYAWSSELRRPVFDWPVGTPCEIKTMDAAAVEVAVDTETGEVEILSHVNADDCGRVIFRKGAENQVEGGIMIQQAQALMFEQIFDPVNGACLNPDFLNNKNPTPLDFLEDRTQGILIESDDACGPYGCKGIGEPVMASYGGIANAIYNAIGVWVKEAPIYPQRILKALGKT